LSEIWGGEIADDEAFADRQELQDFLNLIFHHWNSIVRILQEEDVFAPLLFHEQGGTAQANDWARGFTLETLGKQTPLAACSQ
jgi:yecA family protein